MPSKSAAKGDIQAQADEAADKGYFGTKVDPEPNEAYTLATGPNSPRADGRQVDIADLEKKEG